MTDKNKLKTELNEGTTVTPAITTKWDEPAESKLNEILNRKEFSYDVNGDALYKQYADKFKLGGRMAMMDTMGQAQAMTGGYGNSYAQNVGQQAYQGYMQQLNDVIPELYSLAYGMYNDEGERLLNEYGLLSGERDKAYNAAINDRNYNYQVDRDKVADEQWRETFDYNKKQDSNANKLTEAQIAASLGDYSKLNKLGYDTSSVGKVTESSIEPLSDERLEALELLIEEGNPDKITNKLLAWFPSDEASRTYWASYCDDIMEGKVPDPPAYPDNNGSLIPNWRP